MDNISKINSLGFVQGFLAAFPSSNLYLVGGSVRDALIGIESNDFDLVAENIDINELESFLGKFGRVIPISGRAFGVVKFRPMSSNLTIDIALPRREEYLIGRRRKDATVSHKKVTIIDDLARRDFTINAMALLLCKKESTVPKGLVKMITDPFGGVKDLENKVIRAVGEPKERFLEDPTRILRGIRFAVKFGFTIDSATKKSMKELAPEITKKFTDQTARDLERVSPEMVGQEFTKTFTINPVLALELYDEIGLLKLLLPELEAMKNVPQPKIFHSEGDVFVHTKIALANLPPESSLDVKLATLLHDIGKPPTFESEKQTSDRIRFNGHDYIGSEMARAVLNRLRFSGEITDNVVWLIKNHMKMLFAFPKMRLDRKKNFVRNPLFEKLIQLVRADAMATVPEKGEPNLDFLLPVKKIMAEIEEDDRKGKPRELMNGNEIIKVVTELRPDFDSQKEGVLIGKLKKTINSLYDRGKLAGKEDARNEIKKFFKDSGN